MSKLICYTKRKQHYQNLLNKLDQLFNRFVYLKLTVLIIGLFGTIYWLVLKKYPLGFGLFLLGIVLLIYLDIGHQKVITCRKYTTILMDINDHSIWRLDGRWNAFPDTGSEFRDDNHPYTSDLDIFGPGSLFQMINVTNTYLGRRKLAQILSIPPEPIPVIHERQTTIAELAKSLSWRQRFLAHGIALTGQLRDPGFLFKWVNNWNPFFLQQPVILSIRLLPILTIGSILVFLFTKKIPIYLPIFMLVFQYGLLKIGKKKRTITFETAAGYEKNLQLYANLICQLLKKDYRSPYLQKLKQKLFNQHKNSAEQQLKTLAKIIDWLTIRYNPLYWFINLVTLCDYQCLIALECWKKESGAYLKDWLEAIAEFEALASLAIIAYDHPEWTTPKLVTSTPFVTAENLGHPLIQDNVRINNPLSLDNRTKVLLITGSNMSGKSTYLRTVGINLVLAYAGAPVCAKSFRGTLLDIYTCMRISDNLEKNISTFYAELLRIKSIVQASAESRSVIFLLDEIFKGTNSLDRHTGAKILIKKLIQNQAIGLVSTHDLELGELEQEQTSVKNYHFLESYQNNQLNFDYQLRPGISNTRNALFLMKAAGIIIEESS